MGNIYDGAFRTILKDCRQMIIPVINEIFKEDYIGNEIIEFHPNEHFISLPDGEMTIRLFEYDAQTALDDGKVTWIVV